MQNSWVTLKGILLNKKELISDGHILYYSIYVTIMNA